MLTNLRFVALLHHGAIGDFVLVDKAVLGLVGAHVIIYILLFRLIINANIITIIFRTIEINS